MKRLLVLAFIWGWSFLFIKVAVEGMTPTTVAFGRCALGAIALAAAAKVLGLRLPGDASYWRHVGISAVFANVIPFTLLAWGEQHISSALTAVLNASTPLFTAMFAVAWFKDRIDRRGVLGLLVGIAGVAVAAGVGGGDLAGASLWGSLASVGAGASYGLQLNYAKRHLVDVPPAVAALGQLVAASVLLAPLSVVTTARQGIDLEPHRVLAIVLLGAVGTGVAYLLYYRSVADLGPTTTSLVTYLIPVVAVVIGVVGLGEEFHLRVVFGGLMIVAGIALVQRRLRLPRRRAAVPASTGG